MNVYDRQDTISLLDWWLHAIEHNNEVMKIDLFVRIITHPALLTICGGYPNGLVVVIRKSVWDK